MIRNQDLKEATLDGCPCRALAWTEVKRVDVLKKGKASPVTGLRTWRGVAEIDQANARTVSGWVNHPVSYTGVLHAGEDQHAISASVFITFYRRARPSPFAADGTEEPSASSSFYVEFTGAGNLL